MKKNILATIIVFLIAVFAVYQGFFKREEPNFTLFEIVKASIVQEVSETGQVQKGDKINLGFKSSGRIERIFVEKGKNVERGEVLAKLDAFQLQVQVQQAESAADAAKAKLDKLLAGAGPEEIKVKQTEVSNKQTALDQANQDLNDAYDDTLVDLDDACLKSYNAKNTADLIYRTYFSNSDQETIAVKKEKDGITVAVSQIKSSVDEAKSDATKSKIDSSLSQVKNKLSEISDSLKTIRDLCETALYYNKVSSSDKTSLDTQRSNIITALTNTVDSQQAISSAKLAFALAEGKLQAARDDLDLLLAPARQEDVALYKAQVGEAEAKVRVLETQIQDVYLRSPAKGQITDIKKRPGEIAQSPDVVCVLLPAVPFEIKVDVYEEDVVKINIGNSVDISLVSFPGQVFKGKVAAINPAEDIIEGVVYYEVVIVFDSAPENIKPGMTADVVIKTASRENVLVVPEEAVDKKDNKTTVQILDGKVPAEREIQTGLWGTDGNVEAVSGLSEGEKVVIFK